MSDFLTAAALDLSVVDGVGSGSAKKVASKSRSAGGKITTTYTTHSVTSLFRGTVSKEELELEGVVSSDVTFRFDTASLSGDKLKAGDKVVDASGQTWAIKKVLTIMGGYQTKVICGG